MTGEISIGPASKKDVPDLLRFWALAGENDGRPADGETAVRRLIERDPEATIVAFREGSIVGSIVAGWDGWRANLYRLAVHPGHRGQGIARLLLEHAERRLADVGATRFCAMVLEGNDVGGEFWQAAGYAPQQDWRRWVKPVG